MNDSGAVRFDFREGFFLDGCDDHFVSLSTGRIEHQERKAPLPAIRPSFPFLSGIARQCK